MGSPAAALIALCGGQRIPRFSPDGLFLILSVCIEELESLSAQPAARLGNALNIFGVTTDIARTVDLLSSSSEDGPEGKHFWYWWSPWYHCCQEVCCCFPLLGSYGCLPHLLLNLPRPLHHLRSRPCCHHDQFSSFSWYLPLRCHLHRLPDHLCQARWQPELQPSPAVWLSHPRYWFLLPMLKP